MNDLGMNSLTDALATRDVTPIKLKTAFNTKQSFFKKVNNTRQCSI